METTDVISRIEQALSNGEGAVADGTVVEVSGADCNFTTRVISTAFDGLRPVQRQQKVLSAFSDVLSDGRLHALSIEAFTPGEWEARSTSSLTQLS